jgi:hypothetical protein
MCPGGNTWNNVFALSEMERIRLYRSFPPVGPINTRVTSRQLARRALSVHSSRVLPCGQIAVDGARTNLQGLPNLRHGEATLIQ